MFGQSIGVICRRFFSILLIFGLVACCIVPTIQAKELKDACRSLEWAPEDTAFFSAMLRCGEQVDAIANSRAWARIKQMPVVLEGLEQFEAEAETPGTPASLIKNYMQNPQMGELLTFLGDMFDEEVFVFGDKHFVDLIALFRDFSTEVRRMQMLAISEGNMEDFEFNQKQQMMLSLAVKHLDKFVIPSTVVGFKVEDTILAKKQLSNLGGVLTMFSMFVPQMNGRFERTLIDENEFLLLKFDGEMVPWEQIPLYELEAIEKNEGDAKKLIEKVKALKFVISIGIRDNYFLVSTGPSTDVVTNLGNGKSLLTRPEITRLAPFAEERLTSISYVSKPLNTMISDSSGSFDQIVNLLQVGLTNSGLDEEDQETLVKDAKELVKEIKEAMPEAGAMSSVSFLTSEGLEGYSYSWGKNLPLDSTAPLSLLTHLGGDPILAFVARSPNSIEKYNQVVSWTERARNRIDTMFVPKLNPQEREQFEQIAKRIDPLLKRVHTINRTLLLPSLASSETAVVLDSKMKSSQPIQELDAFEESMPMPEPAIVLSLTDAKKFRKACKQYLELLDDVVDAIREIDPDSIPEDYTIPRPTTEETKKGTLSTWKFPEHWGIDPQIEITGAITDRVAVLGASPKHVQRLLAKKPLSDKSMLGETEKPRGSAILLNVAGLLEALRPWADLGARAAIAEQGISDEKEVLDQVHTVIDVLQCIRTATSEAYIEDDTLVQHSRIVIQDVD